MTATSSSMPQLGTKANDFKLIDKNKEKMTLDTFKGEALLLMFICNHCPYVVHIAEKFSTIAAACQINHINCLAINSNDITKYPDDSPEKMIEFSKKYKLNFPYVFDKSQQMAKDFKAECTPDFFLYDKEHKLFYRGQMDDSRPGSKKPVTGKDLLEGIRLLSKGEKAPENQKPSIGCNIKWT